MTVPRLFYLYLWIAPHALQAVLVRMMFHRKLFLQFPAFFTYTVYEVVQFVALFAMAHVRGVVGYQYVTVWMVGEAISIMLRFAVVTKSSVSSSAATQLCRNLVVSFSDGRLPFS